MRKARGARRAASRPTSSVPKPRGVRVPKTPKSSGFRRVLIANRGEIAVRIIRTLREMGITSIAVFSEPDREALHVLLADEAYPVGSGPSQDSYLNLERIIETARRTRADAVHPGYGFFAENATFARACADAGITFIGPRPETVAALGDKLAAREVARRADAPVIPASEPLASREQAARAAPKIGYPLMLKAAAGGGGKGMRVVRTEAELASAWELTRGEARAAFGDDRVYAERFLERPRHVEAQIIADTHGHVAFLGERECSIQRRHQKLLEETPAPLLDAKTRATIGRVACRLAREVDYVGAGTVEFILDADGSFYFLEVNTRLQVEHPVTEMVTGVDLVAEQVGVAEGRPLSFDKAPEPRGWSMEARICAEDPLQGFMPSIGRIERIRLPQGPGVRNDAGVYRGYQIPLFYDPLMAKLIVWGQDRDHARRRLARALDEYVLEGVHHNLVFHRWLVEHPDFAAGRLSTRFLEEHFVPSQLGPSREATEVALLAAALHARLEREAVSVPGNGAGRSAWRWAERRRGAGRGWR